MGKIIAFIIALLSLFEPISYYPAEEDMQCEIPVSEEVSVVEEIPEQKIEKIHVHNPGVSITVREPTCTKLGLSEVRCIECGEILSQEAILETEHTYSGYELIQEASLYTDEIYRDYCTVCGEVRDEIVTTYEQKIGEEQAVRGNLGRLLIPDVDIDVALFDAHDDAQQIVDNYDSAAYMDWEMPNIMIADHCYQGFTMTKYVQVGTTEAYIVSSSGTKTLVCIDVIPDAVNAVTDLTYSDMTPISDVYSGKYLMYTCNGYNWRSVTVTIWDEVS